MKKYFFIYMRFIFISLLILCASCTVKNRQPYSSIHKNPTTIAPFSPKFLSPKESLKTMHLPKGYHMELVASEPMISEPVTMTWDANGKLYVAQMLTYMQDIDGTNENKPWSKISVLEDTNNDGKMDKSTVFIDSLLLPRSITALDDRIIVRETYNESMWSYRDTDGDNIADEKILIKRFKKLNRSNLEHQPASLMWSIDNYLYSSNSSIRYRFTHNKIETDTLQDAPNGQWGLTQDEVGQLYYSSAGGETPALGYQQHPSYGNLELQGNWEPNFEQVWPIIETPDVQGGLKRLRENGTLNHFTASCGQSIFLGDKLPFYGDLFIPEPVGRLIRRAKVNRVNGKTILSNAYKQTEFLASTDANFRPVETKTGPDGCLYVVDMYRGIIQEGNWVRKGSFLRPVVEKTGLDKNIGKGRIYRIVKDAVQPGKTEKILNKTPQQLLTYLNHDNGWYRMTAQKLIILKGDTSIIPSLKKITTQNSSPIGRLHALWTLEGLDAINPNDIIKMFNDKDLRVQQAALRISERFLAKKNTLIFKNIEKLKNTTNKDLAIQIILSLRANKNVASKNLIQELMDKNPENEVIQITGTESLKTDPPIIDQLKKQYVLSNSKVRDQIVEGYEHFKNICSACHGAQGKGVEGLAPSLIGSPRVTGDKNTLIKILLHGLTGPINGNNYAGVMVGMKNQDDQWISSVLTYIRKHLNHNNQIGTWQVAKVRKQYKNREDYWTIEELTKKQSSVAKKNINSH